MQFFRIFLAILLCILIVACNVSFSTDRGKALPSAKQGTDQQSNEAIGAARKIVARLDSGQFGDVWEESSSLMKGSSSKDVFTKLMQTTRGNLGTPGKREKARVGFTETVDQDAPKGDYAIVEVDTPFGDKLVTEKIVLYREDGTCKLAGYFMNTSWKFG